MPCPVRQASESVEDVKNPSPAKSARERWVARFQHLAKSASRVASSSTTAASAVMTRSRPATDSSSVPSAARRARSAAVAAGRRRRTVGPQERSASGVKRCFHRWYMAVTPPSAGVAPRAKRRPLPRMGSGRGPAGAGPRGGRAAAAGDSPAPPVVASITTSPSPSDPPDAAAREAPRLAAVTSALEQARKRRASPATGPPRAVMTAATSASQSPWRGNRKFLPGGPEGVPSSRKATMLK